MNLILYISVIIILPALGDESKVLNGLENLTKPVFRSFSPREHNFISVFKKNSKCNVCTFFWSWVSKMVAKLISAFFSINLFQGCTCSHRCYQESINGLLSPFSLSWCYYSCPCRHFLMCLVLVSPIHNSHQSANSLWPR